MVAVRSITPKHRSWAKAGNTDRFTLPRRIYQSGKFRARRPVPANLLAFLHHPTTRDGKAFVRMIGFPQGEDDVTPYDVEPLCDPAHWREQLPLELPPRPTLPPVDPENVHHAYPPYKEHPVEHVRAAWPSLGIK